MLVKIVRIGDNELAVPEYYQQVDSMPEDPEGSIPLMALSEGAQCFVLIYEIDPENAMSLVDQEDIIAGIHACLGDTQGLIDVESGDANEHRYMSSIVKTLNDSESSEGVQYTLTIDMERNGAIVHVQGFFSEQGVTGARDAIVFQHFSGDLSLEEAMVNWASDPYDPAYKRGLLMNQSELPEYDEMFPGHPLSMAREFRKVIVTGD